MFTSSEIHSYRVIGNIIYQGHYKDAAVYLAEMFNWYANNADIEKENIQELENNPEMKKIKARIWNILKKYYPNSQLDLIGNIAQDFLILKASFFSGELIGKLICSALRSKHLFGQYDFIKMLLSNKESSYNLTKPISHVESTLLAAIDEKNLKVFKLLLDNYNNEVIQIEYASFMTKKDCINKLTAFSKGKKLLNNKLKYLIRAEIENNQNLIHEFITNKVIWDNYDAGSKHLLYEVITNYFDKFIYKSVSMLPDIKVTLIASIKSLLSRYKNNEEMKMNDLVCIIGTKSKGLIEFTKLYKEMMQNLSSTDCLIPLSFYIDVFKYQLNNYLFQDALHTLSFFLFNSDEEYENNKSYIHLFVQKLYISYCFQRISNEILTEKKFIYLKKCVIKIKEMSARYFLLYNTSESDNLVKGTAEEVKKAQENLVKLDKIIEIYEQYYSVKKIEHSFHYSRIDVFLEWYREFLDNIYSGNLYQLNKLFLKKYLENDFSYIDLYCLFLKLPLINFGNYDNPQRKTPLRYAFSKKDTAMLIKLKRWLGNSEENIYKNIDLDNEDILLTPINNLILYYYKNLSIKIDRVSLWILQDKLENIQVDIFDSLTDNEKEEFKILKSKLDNYLELNEYLNQGNWVSARALLSWIQNNLILNDVEKQLATSGDDVKYINSCIMKQGFYSIEYHYEENIKSTEKIICQFESYLPQQNQLIQRWFNLLGNLSPDEQCFYLNTYLDLIIQYATETINQFHIKINRIRINFDVEVFIDLPMFLGELNTIFQTQFDTGIIAHNKNTLSSYNEQRVQVYKNAETIERIKYITSDNIKKVVNYASNLGEQAKSLIQASKQFLHFQPVLKESDVNGVQIQISKKDSSLTWDFQL